eukprot:377605-Rhodomonas_salina.6
MVLPGADGDVCTACPLGTYKELPGTSTYLRAPYDKPGTDAAYGAHQAPPSVFYAASGATSAGTYSSVVASTSTHSPSSPTTILFCSTDSEYHLASCSTNLGLCCYQRGHVHSVCCPNGLSSWYWRSDRVRTKTN